MTSLVNANIIVPCEILVNGGQGGGSKNEFTFQNGYFTKDKSYTALNDGTWQLNSQVIHFDLLAQPTEVWSRGLPYNTKYVWDSWKLDYIQYPSHQSGRVWDYTIDNSGLLINKTDYSGIYDEFDYDGFLRLKHSNTSNGRSQVDYQFIIGGPNQCSKIISTPSFTQITESFALSGIESQAEYDDYGRNIRNIAKAYTQSGQDYITSTVYDNYGIVVSTCSPLLGGCNEIVTEDNPLGRIARIKSGSDKWVDYNYNYNTTAIGNYPIGSLFETEIIDENDKSTYSYKDIFGNQIASKSMSNCQELITRSEYNDRGQVTYVYPPSGNPYEYQYFNNGLLEKKIIPGKGEYSYVYDPLTDQLTEEFLPNGSHIEYVFDGTFTDFLTFRKKDGINVNEYIPETTIADGLIGEEKVFVEQENQWLSTTYKYDDLGRVTNSVTGFLDGSSMDISNYYDPGGNLRKQQRDLNFYSLPAKTIIEEFDNPNGLRVNETKYTLDGQTITLSSNSYDNRDRLSHKTIGNGLHRSKYLYSNRGWLTDINGIYLYPSVNPQDPCDGDPENVPLLPPGCDEDQNHINFTLFYNCVKLGQGLPTNIKIKSYQGFKTLNNDYFTNTRSTILSFNKGSDLVEDIYTDSTTVRIPLKVDNRSINDGFVNKIKTCLLGHLIEKV